MKRSSIILSLFISSAFISQAADKVLLFTKTAGYRHASIKTGAAAIKKLGAEHNFEVVQSEDANIMNNGDLKEFSGIIFLSTSGDILNEQQQAAFETFIQKGGGFVGIHAATDTETKGNWVWYHNFIGAKFNGHPKNQNAIQRKTEHRHPSVDFLPGDEWDRYDEWYNFKDFSKTIKPVLKLDESTYKGGTNGDDHPSAWFQVYDGGKMFYTAGGHTHESFAEPDFLRHILEGIKWACLGNKLDYSQEIPSDDYFEVTEIIPTLNDPMVMDIASDERIFILEREGAVKMYDPKVGTPVKIHQLPAHYRSRPIEPQYSYRGGSECGGLGIALDPDFDKNSFIYFYYSPIEKDANYVSRFTFKDNQLLDEVKILEVATERHAGPHHAGSIYFGNNRMLYIAAGDNTNPHASDGFAPINETEKGLGSDAQRSAANSNDLRGGILRIIINEDGSYDIPAGNLYPQGTPNTRPEIYIKGCRNPFRIFVDKKKDFVHWGEVGPDGQENGDRGPRGHDEYNIATQAGYFGWPYHVGVEYYTDYNFETKVLGASFAEGITNDSPRNTGLKELPPVTPATIWYPYATSETFPELGSGGRTAMAGPVIYQEGLKHNFPAFFDGKPMFYDWVRGYIKMVSLDENNQCVGLEPFLSNLTFKHPTDIKIGNEGDLYILNYGSAWYGNTDGHLLKVRYGGSNRRPVINVAADKSVGATPLAINFSSAGSVDKDGDAISYHWDFGNGESSSEANPAYSYISPGVYTATLTVKDEKGKENKASLNIIAGNERPVLSLKIHDDDGYFDWGKEISYDVSGLDKEDGSLSTEAIEVVAEYRPDRSIPPGTINTDASATADPRMEGMNLLLPGVKLIEKNHCLACHQSKTKSIGPSYMDVALKYPDSPENRSYLLNKIKNGGNGAFGHIPMPAQAHISNEHIKEMVTAILDMGGDSANITRSKTGSVKTIKRPAHPNNQKGLYVLRANYTDKGANGLTPLSAESESLTLKAPITISRGISKVDAFLASIHGSGAKNEKDRHIGQYRDVNTTLSWKIIVEHPGTYKVTLNQAVNLPQAGATYELHINGQVLSGTAVGDKGWHHYKDIELGEVKLPKGSHSLRFIPKSAPKGYVMNIKQIKFQKTGELEKQLAPAVQAAGIPAQGTDAEKISLSHQQAVIHGDGASATPTKIGHYNDVNTTLSWTTRVTKGGLYQVSVNQGVVEQFKGAKYKVSVNGQSVHGVMEVTQGWENFKLVNIGSVQLNAGEEINVEFIPTNINGVLGNIEAIVLEKIQ